jgi:hypothetical protein
VTHLSGGVEVVEDERVVGMAVDDRADVGRDSGGLEAVHPFA